MEHQDVLNQLGNIQKNMLAKHSKHQLTNEIFDVIFEMLSVDYKSISPGGKRLRIFNEYMLSILKQALESGAYKSYMLDLINIFKDTTISKYLYHSFGNMADDLMITINRLRDRLFAWQGFEGCEWRRLEEIEKILR